MPDPEEVVIIEPEPYEQGNSNRSRSDEASRLSILPWPMRRRTVTPRSVARACRQKGQQMRTSIFKLNIEGDVAFW